LYLSIYVIARKV